MSPDGRIGRTEVLLAGGLVVLAVLVVSPAANLTVAAGGLVAIAGVGSVAAGRSPARAQDAPVPAAEIGGETSRRAEKALPSLWTAFLVTFTVFALDFGAFLSGDTALRYVFLLVPVGVLVVSARSPHGRPVLRPPDVVLAGLFLWGMAGAVYGKLVVHPVSSSLTMVLPIGVGLIHLLSTGRPTEEHSRRMLRYLSNVGLAYVLIYLAARLGGGPLSVVAYSKEKAFLLALAPMAALVTRRWWFFTIELAALAIIFLEEPAATFLVVIAAVAVTNMLLSARGSAVKVAAFALLSLSIFVGLSLVYRSGQQTTVVTKYFAAVGKLDNTPFRLVLLRKGMADVQKRPVLGTNFTGEIGIETKFPGVARFAPAHNDYLQLAMAGGIVALALYLYWVQATNRAVHTSYHLLVAAGDLQSARLLRVLVTGFNAFLFSSIFNPLLAGVGIAVMFFLLYGSMTLLLPENLARSPRRLVAAGQSAG